MRHTEIAEAPCKCGCDRQSAVASYCSGLDVASLEYVKETLELSYVCENIIKSLGSSFCKSENDNKSDRHDDALDEVCS